MVTIVDVVRVQRWSGWGRQGTARPIVTAVVASAWKQIIENVSHNTYENYIYILFYVKIVRSYGIIVPDIPSTVSHVRLHSKIGAIPKTMAMMVWDPPTRNVSWYELQFELIQENLIMKIYQIYLDVFLFRL